MRNVTLFTYLFTWLTSPWRCHEIKCTLWARLLYKKSNSLFFWQLPLINIHHLCEIFAIWLCQYLWKSREQQTKQLTEVSDNEMGLFQVRGVLTIVITDLLRIWQNVYNPQTISKQGTLSCERKWYDILIWFPFFVKSIVMILDLLVLKQVRLWLTFSNGYLYYTTHILSKLCSDDHHLYVYGQIYKTCRTFAMDLFHDEHVENYKIEFGKVS